MSYKTILLFLASVTFIMILYSTRTVNTWLESKIFTICNISEQLEHMDLEERRESRYGYTYMVFKDVAAKIGKIKNATLLMPPQKYYDEMGIKMNEVEPSLFYYYTGVNSVTVATPKPSAVPTWALLSEKKGQISLYPVPNKAVADSLIAFLMPYQPKQ